jgi:hypothetical protein
MHVSDSTLAYANISNKSKSPYSCSSLAPFSPYCHIIHPSPPPFPSNSFCGESSSSLQNSFMFHKLLVGVYTCSAILPRETTGFS